MSWTRLGRRCQQPKRDENRKETRVQCCQSTRSNTKQETYEFELRLKGLSCNLRWCKICWLRQELDHSTVRGSALRCSSSFGSLTRQHFSTCTRSHQHWPESRKKRIEGIVEVFVSKMSTWVECSNDSCWSSSKRNALSVRFEQEDTLKHLSCEKLLNIP